MSETTKTPTSAAGVLTADQIDFPESLSDAVVVPGLVASLGCLGLNVGLLRYVYAMERPKP